MSHHGSKNEFVDSTLKELMQEATGKFPDGTLNKSDEGQLALAIGEEDGRVVMRFPKPVAWIGFTKSEAKQIAASLLRHAGSPGDELAGLKKKLENFINKKDGA